MEEQEIYLEVEKWSGIYRAKVDIIENGHCCRMYITVNTKTLQDAREYTMRWIMNHRKSA